MPRLHLMTILIAASACGPDPETEVAPPPTITEHAGAGAVPDTPDPSALAEIVAQAPQTAPPPTAPDGTLVGSDTGEPKRDPPAVPLAARAADPVRVHTGSAELSPALSSAAIERAARAQLYWRLRDCRMPDGSPPPPDAVTLGFTIRQDGSVDPASVTATAAKLEHAEIAVCVLRTFSASPFLGPAAGLDTSARVLITWPSVD